MKKTHIGLYEGIGGFSIAAEALGYETVAWCEWSPFCQTVLKYHFPNAKGFGDITNSDFSEYEGQINLLTAGFPCQPFSVAGNRKGTEDDRYGWPATRRAIKQINPDVVILENVAGLSSILEPESTSRLESKTPILFEDGYDATIVEERRRVLGIIISELQTEGYLLPQYADGTPIVCCIPASAANAPHERYRYWIVGFRRNYINRLIGDAQYNGYTPTQKRGKIAESQGKKKQKTFGGTSRANSLQPSNVGNSNGDHESEVGQILECRWSEENDEPRRISENDATNPNSITGRQQPKFTSSDAAGARKKFGRSGIDAPNSTNSGVKSLQKSEIDLHGLELTSDSDNKRRKEFNIAAIASQQEQQYCERYFGGISDNWTEFPTQSAICSGDDGFPSKLDGIAFSTWRNESIKAYGNAIVPQVAIQIIKTIDEFIETLK